MTLGSSDFLYCLCPASSSEGTCWVENELLIQSVQAREIEIDARKRYLMEFVVRCIGNDAACYRMGHVLVNGSGWGDTVLVNRVSWNIQLRWRLLLFQIVAGYGVSGLFWRSNSFVVAFYKLDAEG